MKLILLISIFFIVSIGTTVTQQPSKKLCDDRVFTRKMSEKLFHENPDQNFVWSPISLEMALAAVMMGANGDTFDQLLERVFNAPDRHYYLTDLVSSLKKTSTMYKSEEATLTYATILALDNFFRVKEHYMKKLKFFYSNPPLLRANFAKDGDMVAASINAMVSDATKKRIQDLIPAKSLSAGTAMILVNAVYFNAKFEEKFERITMDTFYGLNGQKSVEFLTRKFSSLPYYEDRDIKMIILPFVESKFNLYVAIKKNMRRASQQEKRSSMQKLMEMVLGGAMNDKFEKKSVEVQLPKFKIEYTAKKLVENFKSLGVRDLFNGSAANFEQMLEKRHKVAVTNIRHKAFIEIIGANTWDAELSPISTSGLHSFLYIDVSETGVEAAAASAIDVGFRISTSEPSHTDVRFRAKDPFFFYITMKHEGRLNQYESVLFAGQYAAP